jgi:hypothetical protein
MSPGPAPLVTRLTDATSNTGPDCPGATGTDTASNISSSFIRISEERPRMQPNPCFPPEPGFPVLLRETRVNDGPHMPKPGGCASRNCRCLRLRRHRGLIE